MNIGIDIRLLAKGGTGGIPGYTRELLRNLLALDKQNSYSLFYNGFNKLPLAEEIIAKDKVKVFSSRFPNRLLDLSVRAFNLPHIEYFLPEIDLMFSPHFNILAAKKIPRVITFHDLSFIRFPSFFSYEQKVWHWLQDYRRQALLANHIIAVSEFTKADLVNLLGIDEKKISVTYLGIGSEFRPIALTGSEFNNFRQKYGLDRPYWLYLGALEERKNVGSLIKAFEKIASQNEFSDFMLVLAGRPGFGAKKILGLAKQSFVASRIKFIHDLPDYDRPFLYSGARLFIYPSFFEGFGFPPLEAQACGIPVIAADRSSLSEVLADSALLVDPWQTGDLADAISYLESSPSLRGKIIESGKKNAARFNWTDTAKQTLSILKKVNENF